MQLAEGYTLLYRGHRKAIVVNESGEIEVFQSSPDFSGWGLDIDGVKHEYVRKATEQDLGVGGGYGDALRRYLKAPTFENLAIAYRRADLQNQRILRSLDSRVVQVAELEAKMHEVRERLYNAFRGPLDYEGS